MTADEARAQAERELKSNQAWSNTNSWDATSREQYEIERRRLERQQEEQRKGSQ